MNGKTVYKFAGGHRDSVQATLLIANMVSAPLPVAALLLASAALVLGARQSPIDIQANTAKTNRNLSPLKFSHYHSSQSSYSISNSGHGAQIALDNWLHSPKVQGGPLDNTFVLKQVHFHWGKQDGEGSEHYLNGEPASMEVHLVHWNSKYKTYENAAEQDDGLAVVGFFMEGVDSYKNPEFQKVVDLIPKIKSEKGKKVATNADLLSWVVPYLKSGGYFAYDGSLTTEPYSENVSWIMFKEPVIIGASQIKAFREMKSAHHELLKTNKRELQSVNDRQITWVPEA